MVMNALTKKTGLIALLLLVVLTLSVWFYVHKRQNQNYLKVKEGANKFLI